MNAPAITDRRERTRQAILAAAFLLIGREGGLAVRIEEICTEARISRGSFYNYFNGLEDLFAALSYTITHGFIGAVLAEMATMASAAEQSDYALRQFLEKARADPAWGWAMVNVGAMGPLFGEETHAAALGTVSEGIARGEFTIPDARMGRDLVLGTAHAAIQSHLRAGSHPDMPRIAARAVLAGLGVADERIGAIVGRTLTLLS